MASHQTGAVRAREYTADDNRRHVLIGLFAPTDATVTTKANNNTITVEIVYPYVNPVNVAAFAYNKSQAQLFKKLKVVSFAERNQSSTP